MLGVIFLIIGLCLFALLVIINKAGKLTNDKSINHNTTQMRL